MYIVYIYENDGTTPITQIYDAYNIELTHKLNSYDLGSFSVKADHEKLSLTNMQVYNRVKIGLLADGVETIYFDGLLAAVEADINSCTIYLKGYEWILEKKYIYVDNSYSDTLDNIVSDILDTINGRYDTGITLDCGVSTSVAIEVKRGASMLSVLQEITKLGYEFRVMDMVLNVKESVGQDKSTAESSAGYVLLEWDTGNVSLRNVKGVRVVQDGDQLTNAVFGRTESFDTDGDSITQYGRIERFITGDVDEATLVSDTLDKNKDLLKQIEIDPETDDFFFVDIGDTIAVSIVGLNSLINYMGTAKIVEKKLDQRGFVKVTVSKNSVRSLNFFEQIKDYDRRLQKLEQ